jgi:ubiquitin thioesterase OTU1
VAACLPPSGLITAHNAQPSPHDSFTTEIASFDVQSGRADRFGEGQYDSRCVLVYSGIREFHSLSFVVRAPGSRQPWQTDHPSRPFDADYDAVTTSPMRDAPREFQTTVFPISDETILPAAKELVRRLKEQRYYTDTAGFDLRCQVGPTARMRSLWSLER